MDTHMVAETMSQPRWWLPIFVGVVCPGLVLVATLHLYQKPPISVTTVVYNPERFVGKQVELSGRVFSVSEGKNCISFGLDDGISVVEVIYFGGDKGWVKPGDVVTVTGVFRRVKVKRSYKHWIVANRVMIRNRGESG